MDSYAKAVNRILELQKFGIKLGLSSTKNLLSRLGDPHLGLPAVHLAGTNGKGSIGAMLEATLREAGVKVGFYTSPHLERFTERFVIDGKEIEEDRVVELAEAVWKVVDQREPPTVFELVTAMAFLYFAQEKVDISIIEVGMGGRLDATNLCRPLATVITNIALEHTEYLGRTLSHIAWEKAGIIKPGVPLMHGVRRDPARRVVEDRARELGAPINRLGRELTFRRGDDGAFSLKGNRWSLKGLSTNLAGRHQPTNAALALGVAEVLEDKGYPVQPEHFRQGLTKVRWPGRLEKWPTAPGEAEVWLDGAHNQAAAKALLATLPTIVRDRKPVILVVGIMADKKIAEILSLILKAGNRVIYTRPVYQRAADPEVLAAQAPAWAPPSEIEPDLGLAIQKARREAGPRGLVLITGSLFTVGEARTLLTGCQAN